LQDVVYQKDILRMAILYIATNKINNKKYVGITSQKLSSRIAEHIRDSRRNDPRYVFKFQRAIKKYGAENFEWIAVLENDNYEKIKSLERATINILGTYSQQGYNSTGGGDGRFGGGKQEVVCFNCGKKYFVNRNKFNNNNKRNLKFICSKECNSQHSRNRMLRFNNDRTN